MYYIIVIILRRIDLFGEGFSWREKKEIQNQRSRRVQYNSRRAHRVFACLFRGFRGRRHRPFPHARGYYLVAVSRWTCRF